MNNKVKQSERNSNIKTKPKTLYWKQNKKLSKKRQRKSKGTSKNKVIVA